MRPTTRRPIVAVILLCAAGACAPAAGSGELHSSLPEAGAGWVEVTNDGQQDVTLYMLRDGARYRLGHVARMQTARFRVPRTDGRPSYSVTLIADPSGGGSIFGTESIRWRPGQTLVARVGRRAFSQSFDVVLR